MGASPALRGCPHGGLPQNPHETADAAEAGSRPRVSRSATATGSPSDAECSVREPWAEQPTNRYSPHGTDC